MASSAQKSKGNGAGGPVARRKVRVSVRDNEVVLTDFHETDPQVVALARQADHAEAAMHNAFEVGARAIKLAEVSQDSQIVESAFGQMRSDFDGKMEETVEKLEEATDALFDEEEGMVPSALEQFHGDLERLLGDAFDPDSKRSIIGRFDAAVRALLKDERAAIRRLMDPGDEGSPLYRLHRDLDKAVHDESKELRSLIGEVSEKIAVRAAEEELIDKTASKGRSFEDVLHDVVSSLVAPYGDLAEQTGDVAGASGRKAGDEVVTLNEDDTRGAEAAYVFEAKTGSKGLKAMLSELDAAMENRNASAGIAVFSRGENAPTGVPFWANGDKAIVVLDREELDSAALRLSTMWARWVVRRKLAEDEGEVDVEAVNDLIDRASRALSQHATIKGCHTSAHKKIDEAGRHVDGLVQEVRDTLDELRDLIDSE